MNGPGASLVELVVAATIVGVGVVGVASLTATAARTMVRARALDHTHALLQGFVDSARVAGAPGSGESALPVGTLGWSVPDAPGAEAWVWFDHVALPDTVLVRFVVASAPGNR